MNQVKVPSSIQEAFTESTALESLASQMLRSWWFSPKALVYQMKAEKVRQLAWKALRTAHPRMTSAWTYDGSTGIASAPQAPVEPKVKKPRAPRAPKVQKTEPKEV